jgi:hypothetical protein
MRRLKVVYLLGAARSGTSLLTSLLGEIPGFFAAAEMRLLWGGFDTRLCGCGAPVAECPIWSTAIAAARGISGLQAPEQFVELQNRTTRTRHVPALAARGPNGDAAAYLDIMTEMYLSLAEASGAAVIVDSSKSAAEAVLLRESRAIDAKLVHVIRDARAVAYSWNRVGWRKPENRRSTLGATFAWLASNGAAEVALGKYGPGSKMRVRYEDYVVEPAAVIAEVANMVETAPGDLTFLQGTSAVSRRNPTHMVGGNRLRFDREVAILKPDAEWRESLSEGRAQFVTAATLPLLLRYGYEARTRGKRREVRA